MMSDAVAAKVRQLREEHEKQGYEVIEQPGPEEFPFETGYGRHYRPALLARRGDENLVFDVRESARLAGQRLIDRSQEVRKHPGWHFYFVSCDDVVPYDAPGVQGEPPEWARLEEHADKALRLTETAPKPVALLALWAVLEGVLRRIAADRGMPTDRLPAALLVTSLYDYGHIPSETYDPVSAAQKVHRRVVHGYDAPDDEIAEAVRVVVDALPRLVAGNLQHAS